MSDTVRIDKWLWAARFFKTRGLAREAIKGGRVQLDGRRVKPSRTLAEGDRLTIRRGDEEFRVTVTDLGDRRLSAALAQDKYVEDAASRKRREAAAEQHKLARQARAERPHELGLRRNHNLSAQALAENAGQDEIVMDDASGEYHRADERLPQSRDCEVERAEDHQQHPRAEREHRRPPGPDPVDGQDKPPSSFNAS